MMVVMVDKMLKTQIVECSTIAKFVFDKDMRSEFTSFYLWEILNSTVSRMSKQVEKLQHEYDEFEEKYKKSQSMLSEVLFSVLLLIEILVILWCLHDDCIWKNAFEMADEDDLKTKQERLSSLKNAQKELFFIIIQCFVDLLNNYKQSENKANDLFEYKWIVDRFQDFLLTVSVSFPTQSVKPVLTLKKVLV